MRASVFSGHLPPKRLWQSQQIFQRIYQLSFNDQVSNTTKIFAERCVEIQLNFVPGRVQVEHQDDHRVLVGTVGALPATADGEVAVLRGDSLDSHVGCVKFLPTHGVARVTPGAKSNIRARAQG